MVVVEGDIVLGEDTEKKKPECGDDDAAGRELGKIWKRISAIRPLHLPLSKETWHQLTSIKWKFKKRDEKIKR